MADAPKISLQEALSFYARGHHFCGGDFEEWESVSGEPPNFLCGPNDDDGMIEDGSVARMALEQAGLGILPDYEDDAEDADAREKKS